VTDQITARVCIWALLGYFFSKAIAMSAAVPMYQLSNSADLGRVAIIRGIGGTVIHIAVFLACVALMWHLGRPKGNSDEPQIGTT